MGEELQGTANRGCEGQQDVARKVVKAVAETRAELIGMPPKRKRSGIPAWDIAHATKVPVLVARPPRSHSSVLLTSDSASVEAVAA